MKKKIKLFFVYLKRKSFFFMLKRKIGLTDKLSDAVYLRKFFYAALGYQLDLDNPVTFNQKMQWLKIYNKSPFFTDLVDKYKAKDIIKSIIGEKYIVPTLGVWDSFDEIDFNLLPDKFVLKCTHDSGGLAICKDKKTFNIKKARKKINKSLKAKFYLNGREYQYKDVKPRIIAEQYLECDEGLRDYKFFNFSCVPKFLYISEGLDNHSTAKISFFDLNGKQLPFKRSDYKAFDGDTVLPMNFEEMISINNKIAKYINNCFVRLDFYNVDGHIYFSEVTFFPNSGLIPFEPKEWDDELGSWIILPRASDLRQ